MATIDGVQDFRQDFVYDRLNRQTSVRQYGQTGNAVLDKRVDFAYDAIGQFDMMTRYANLAGVNQLSLSGIKRGQDQKGSELFTAHVVNSSDPF